MSPGEVLKINRIIDEAGYDVRALLVVRNCKLIFERYRRGLDRENFHTVYSVTKSVTATLAGILVERGQLSLDTPLANLIRRSWNVSSAGWRRAEQITLRHVMGMHSGLDAIYDVGGATLDPLYLTRTDRVAEALRNDLKYPPGTRYFYSDRDAALFGAAVEGAGKGQLTRLAQELLFEPMAFGGWEWLYPDSEGRYPGGWGLRLRPMDMAKLGILYAEKGQWNGRTLLSPAFIQTVWTPGTFARYGLGWWIATGPEFAAFPMRYARGFKGQRIFVFPNHSLAVVVVASLPASETASVDTAVANAVIAAVRAGYRRAPDVEERLAELARAGFEGTTRVPQEAQDRPGR